VPSQTVAGAEGAQHRITALHGALNGGHGQRISVVSAPTDQAPEPHRVSADETRWIPWDLSQGNDTTTVFGESPRTHFARGEAPSEALKPLALQGQTLAVQTISKNGSSEIRTQDQSVKSRRA
jgi:hypothetical protein